LRCLITRLKSRAVEFAKVDRLKPVHRRRGGRLRCLQIHRSWGFAGLEHAIKRSTRHQDQSAHSHRRDFSTSNRVIGGFDVGIELGCHFLDCVRAVRGRCGHGARSLRGGKRGLPVSIVRLDPPSVYAIFYHTENAIKAGNEA
jgi:hypothetical protein